jgi:hypothetical protein
MVRSRRKCWVPIWTAVGVTAVALLVFAGGASASVWTPTGTIGGGLNAGAGLGGVIGIDDAPNGDLWVTETW